MHIVYPDQMMNEIAKAFSCSALQRSSWKDDSRGTSSFRWYYWIEEWLRAVELCQAAQVPDLLTTREEDDRHHL